MLAWLVLQKMTHQSSKLSVVVAELKHAETPAHKAALMALINAVINCTQDAALRNRVRNEFVGECAALSRVNAVKIEQIPLHSVEMDLVQTKLNA